VIGVTGNIAAGKSEVSRHLAEKGCAFIDADKVAHDLYDHNQALVAQIGSAFGREVLHPDGSLHRRRLAAVVFSDPDYLEQLNRIVHPHLLAALRERLLSSVRVMQRVILDAALIVEWGLHRELDAVILVTAPETLRRARLMEREGLSVEEAERRIRLQMLEDDKRPFATYEIKNEGTIEELRRAADAIWEQIESAQDQT
jgi:dephospho-CoA kinase